MVLAITGSSEVNRADNIHVTRKPSDFEAKASFDYHSFGHLYTFRELDTRFLKMRLFTSLKLLAFAASSIQIAALPQGGAPSSTSGSSITSAPASSGSSAASLSVPGSESTVSTSVSTAVPSPSVAASSPLGNYTLPEIQPWCAGRPGSRIYCPGEILQTVQLAALYADSKTFVDKPTVASEDEVINAFNTNVKGNNTVEALVDWIDTYFAGEGLDVLPAVIANFNETPSFLDEVQDEHIKGWIQQVHGENAYTFLCFIYSDKAGCSNYRLLEGSCSGQCHQRELQRLCQFADPLEPELCRTRRQIPREL